MPIESSSCPMSARALPRPRSSNGTSRSATTVNEDQILAAVMTDKATVEIPSPRAGVIVELGGELGTRLAVGSPLVGIRFGADDEALPTVRNMSRSSTIARERARCPSIRRSGLRRADRHHDPRPNNGHRNGAEARR